MPNAIDYESIRFTANVGETVKATLRTRKGNSKVIGLCLQSYSGDMSIVNTRMRLTIDKVEIFSSDFDPSLLAFKQRTPVNERFYSFINEAINESNVEIEFTGNAFYGGDFSLILKCERND